MSIFLWNTFLQPKNIKLQNKLTRQVLQNFHNIKTISQIQARKYTESCGLKGQETYVPFLNVINLRKLQANRSILVQVQSAQSYNELHSYCNSLGHVKEMFHYVTGVEPMHFIIVEFEKEQDVANILSASTHTEDVQVVPTHSHFLWFRASNRKLAKLKQSKNAKLACENGTRIAKDAEVLALLKKCETVSEQMKVLHETTKLNDIGTRLRYLTAKQIENMVFGMFPNASVYPFGSSVNGFGRMGCDLDLILRLNESKNNDMSRLVFHCKAHSGSERSTSQKHMEAMGDMIHLFLPGCSQVRRILQARVPIIKYYQQFTNVECDLSLSNMSGVHMSDFLYMMGAFDSRVRPLVFTIRKWASEVGLTNSSPGRWITNFSLTLLVLAFLQKPLSSPPILPSLNTLTNQAEKTDHFITEDGINCSFLRNLNKLRFKSENTDPLEVLLRQFFEYYSQFDFATKAVCLNEAVALTKPEYSAMYIVNPLERGLNVSKNVSFEELEKFKLEVRNAAWNLESQENKSSNWGLLSIFDKKPVSTLSNLPFTRHSRLMDVKVLFDEEDETQEKEETKINFKNLEVKKQVENIKKDTINKIKELQKNR